MKPQQRGAAVFLFSGLGIILTLKILGGMLEAAMRNVRDRTKLNKKSKSPIQKLVPLTPRECMRIEIDRQIH